MHDALFHEIQVPTDLQCFLHRIHFLINTTMCDDADPLYDAAGISCVLNTCCVSSMKIA
jgi:hypothetical protein